LALTAAASGANSDITSLSGLTTPISVAQGGTGITSFGTGVATALGQNVSGSGSIALTGSPAFTTPNLGTPSALVLTNATGTPTSIVLTNGTGLPISTGLTGAGTGVLTALAVNIGSAGAFVTFNGALGTPSSGTLSACTVDGTNAVGFRTIPVNPQSGDYTAVLSDSGKSLYHPTTDANPRTFTIPANASVAYAVGTAITFVNDADTLTIAITSDTLVMSPGGTTGSRSLAAYGMATAIKVTSTRWLISGSGLT
jgi:hypothetical protein